MYTLDSARTSSASLNVDILKLHGGQTNPNARLSHLTPLTNELHSRGHPNVVEDRCSAVSIKVSTSYRVQQIEHYPFKMGKENKKTTIENRKEDT